MYNYNWYVRYTYILIYIHIMRELRDYPPQKLLPIFSAHLVKGEVGLLNWWLNQLPGDSLEDIKALIWDVCWNNTPDNLTTQPGSIQVLCLFHVTSGAGGLFQWFRVWFLSDGAAGWSDQAMTTRQKRLIIDNSRHIISFIQSIYWCHWS